MNEAPVTAIPSAADPAYYVDEELVLRRFCCPGCRVQVGAEIAKLQEPIRAEMRLS
jgi:N-methylhydantoinase B